MTIEERKQGAGPEARALGMAIVYLRMRAGYLQKDLAKELKVRNSRLSKWEWGRVRLQSRSRDKVVRFFGMSRSDLQELAERLARSVGRSSLDSRVADAWQEGELKNPEAALEEVRLRRRHREEEHTASERALHSVLYEEQDLIRRLREVER